jgi:hypothetical protein
MKTLCNTCINKLVFETGLPRKNVAIGCSKSQDDAIPIIMEKPVTSCPDYRWAAVKLPIVKCNCEGHAIEIDAEIEKGLGLVWLNFWYGHGLTPPSDWRRTWKERIKAAWQTLRGERVPIEDFVFDFTTVRELSQLLDQAADQAEANFNEQ